MADFTAWRLRRENRRRCERIALSPLAEKAHKSLNDVGFLILSDAVGLKSGADDRNRTYDPHITNVLLYRLSYIGCGARILANPPVSGKLRVTIDRP